MAEDRFDNLYMTLAQQAGDLDSILDSFFGFLGRRTDFYRGASKAEALKRLTHAFDKHYTASEQRKQAEAEKYRKADEEREKKKREAEAKAQKAPKIEELDEDTPKIEEISPAKTAATSADGAGDEEAGEEEGPAPVGNGGKTDKFVWTQTLGTVELTVPVNHGTKSRDLQVDMTQTKLSIKYKNSGAIIVAGEWHGSIKTDDAMWTLVDSSQIQITLEKYDSMKWWSCVLKGDPEIDTKKIVPENSKLGDLDGETRQTVEKMMHDQRQKQLGLPSSDQQKQHDMLGQFKKAHPEMDFSNCKINYGGNDAGNFNLGQ